MTKRIIRSTFALLFIRTSIGCAQKAGSSGSTPVKLDTDDQKTLYALGLLMGNNVQPFGLTPEELEIVKAGVTDVVTGAKAQVELDTYGPKVNELAQKRASVVADAA